MQHGEPRLRLLRLRLFPAKDVRINGLNQSMFVTEKALQAKLCPLIKDYCLLSNCPWFAHVEVFNCDGKYLTYAQSRL
jgi:hypothetical protein